MGTQTDNPNGSAPFDSTIPPIFDKESQAFDRLLPELRASYPGEFVAITGSGLVDHDIDAFVLGKRVREKYHGQFVLVRSVEQTQSTSILPNLF